MSLKPKHLSTLEASDIQGPFLASTAESQDEQPATISIDCHHEALEVQHIYNLALSFVEAIEWTEDHGRTTLKKSLHDFLSQLHVTSLWRRGQASAAQIFVEAFNEFHGEDLVFPANWQADPLRQNVFTDQQFLSDFDDRETSFEKFDKQVLFVARGSSNTSNTSNSSNSSNV